MEKTVKKFGRPNLIIALVVIIAVVIGGVYEYHHSHAQSKTSNIKVVPAGWKTYQNSQYGFEFKYPPVWGTPTLHVTMLKGTTAVALSFSNVMKVGNTYASLLLSIDPNSPAANAKAIQKQIDGAKNSSLITTTTSYAIVANPPSLNLSSLQLYQIINMPKLKATGAIISFQIPKAPSDCPKDKLSSEVGCVTNTDYITLNQIAKSIESL